MVPDGFDPTETAELVRRAQAGDDRARGVLFERYQDQVLELVRRRLGARLRQELESVDVAQSVFLDAVRGLDRFDDRGEQALIRWLAGVVENKLRNKARDRRSRKRDHGELVPIAPPDSEAPSPTVDPPGPQSTPSISAARREEVERLRQALEALKPTWRQVVELRAIRELSWPEVAERLGETEKTVQGRYARARARLATLMVRLDESL